MRSTVYWIRRLKCVRIWNVVDAANAILVFTQKPRNSFSDTWAFVWFQVISSSATTQHALHEKHRKWRNCVKFKPLISSRAFRRNDLALGIPDKFRLTLAVTLFLARKVESHSATSTFDSFQTFVKKGNDHRKDGQKYWHKWRKIVLRRCAYEQNVFTERTKKKSMLWSREKPARNQYEYYRSTAKV